MEHALAELNKHEKRLLAYIMRRHRDPSGAEDILQETMMRVVEQSRKQELTNPAAYAYRVADNVIYGLAKRRKREAELGDQDFECELPLADEQLEYKQRLALFQKALDRLPPLRRKVFAKRHLEGRSRDEIARELDLSVEAVKKHLVRAMTDLTIAMTQARAPSPSEKAGRRGSGA